MDNQYSTWPLLCEQPHPCDHLTPLPRNACEREKGRKGEREKGRKGAREKEREKEGGKKAGEESQKG